MSHNLHNRDHRKYSQQEKEDLRKMIIILVVVFVVSFSVLIAVLTPDIPTAEDLLQENGIIENNR